MCEELIDAFKQKVLEDGLGYYKFFRTLKGYRPSTIVCFCRWIISEFSYPENPQLIKEAYQELAHKRDVTSFPGFRALENDWKNTYYNEYQYLFALFSNAASGAECNCSVYQDGRFNAPPYQDDIEILSRKTSKQGYFDIDVLHVRCAVCGKEYDVEIDYIYHYPHSHWRSRKTTYSE